jgi:hypothetical protein
MVDLMDAGARVWQGERKASPLPYDKSFTTLYGVGVSLAGTLFPAFHSGKRDILNRVRVCYMRRMLCPLR